MFKLFPDQRVTMVCYFSAVFQFWECFLKTFFRLFLFCLQHISGFSGDDELFIL